MVAFYTGPHSSAHPYITAADCWYCTTVLCTAVQLLVLVCPVLSPIVEVFTFSQLLEHPGSELGPVFILELLEAQGQMELCRVAAQERIVLPLFPNSGGTLEIKFMSKSSPAQNKCV